MIFSDMTLEIFMMMKAQVMLFWVMTSEDRSSMVLWNVGILPHHHMVL